MLRDVRRDYHELLVVYLNHVALSFIRAFGELVRNRALPGQERRDDREEYDEEEAWQLDLDCEFDALEHAFDYVSAFEFARALAYEWHNHRDLLSERVKDGRLELGWRVTYPEYRAGIATLQDYRNRFFTAFEGYDLLITPSANGEALQPAATQEEGPQ